MNIRILRYLFAFIFESIRNDNVIKKPVSKWRKILAWGLTLAFFGMGYVFMWQTNRVKQWSIRYYQLDSNFKTTKENNINLISVNKSLTEINKELSNLELRLIAMMLDGNINKEEIESIRKEFNAISTKQRDLVQEKPYNRVVDSENNIIDMTILYKGEITPTPMWGPLRMPAPAYTRDVPDMDNKPVITD